MVTFAKLWNLHWRWRRGIFLKRILSGNTVDIYEGIPYDYYSNFAAPRVHSPTALDLQEVAALVPKDLFSAIHLLESHKTHGFYEYLARHHYRYHSTGSWLVYDGPLKPDIPQYPGVEAIRKLVEAGLSGVPRVKSVGGRRRCTCAGDGGRIAQV